jgi:DNA-binding NarL/FixJ family response regulator
MPGISGLEAARLIGKLHLSARALIVTVHQSARLESEVREAALIGISLLVSMRRQSYTHLVVCLRCEAILIDFHSLAYCHNLTSKFAKLSLDHVHVEPDRRP